MRRRSSSAGTKSSKQTTCICRVSSPDRTANAASAIPAASRSDRTKLQQAPRATTTRAEIAEQPAVVAALLQRERGSIERLAAEMRHRRPRYAVIAARGSSDNVARYAQHALGRLAGLPVVLATPSLHTLYDAPPRYV